MRSLVSFIVLVCRRSSRAHEEGFDELQRCFGWTVQQDCRRTALPADEDPPALEMLLSPRLLRQVLVASLCQVAARRATSQSLSLFNARECQTLGYVHRDRYSSRVFSKSKLHAPPWAYSCSDPRRLCRALVTLERRNTLIELVDALLRNRFLAPRRFTRLDRSLRAAGNLRAPARQLRYGGRGGRTLERTPSPTPSKAELIVPRIASPAP